MYGWLVHAARAPHSASRCCGWDVHLCGVFCTVCVLPRCCLIFCDDSCLFTFFSRFHEVPYSSVPMVDCGCHMTRDSFCLLSVLCNLLSGCISYLLIAMHAQILQQYENINPHRMEPSRSSAMDLDHRYNCIHWFRYINMAQQCCASCSALATTDCRHTASL